MTPRATLYQTRVYQSGKCHKAIDRVLTEHIIGNKMASNANNKDTIHIPIPKSVSLSIKSDVISVKYVVHVTLDIPHAVDLSINLPIIVTTQSALDRNLG